MRYSYSRWNSAYQAYQRAENPEWKQFWLKVMKHFQRDFN